MPRIRVEFYGIPRVRAGIAAKDVDATTVRELCQILAQQLPAFAAACLNNDQLSAETLLSINGRNFTRDPAIELHEGDVVLIFSADVGG